MKPNNDRNGWFGSHFRKRSVSGESDDNKPVEIVQQPGDDVTAYVPGNPEAWMQSDVFVEVKQ